MNIVNIIGNLTTRPELMKAGELSYTRFSIAVNSFHKGEKKVEFFNIVAFGKNAETICKNLDKGYTLPIVGHLKQDKYKNKDGKTVSSVSIYLDSFTFVNNKVTTKEECDYMNNDAFLPFN